MLDQEDEHGNFTPGEWRNDCSANLAELQAAAPRRTSTNAEEIRRVFTDHFNGPKQSSFSGASFINKN